MYACTCYKIASQGFDYHIENEDNMWDYIKYIMHLEEIDVSDHNAIEHFVHQQVKCCTLVNFLYFGNEMDFKYNYIYRLIEKTKILDISHYFKHAAYKIIKKMILQLT